MPKYHYKAINENGASLKEVVEADSVEIANSIITARGHIPVGSIKDESDDSAWLTLKALKERFTPIDTAELIIFTKQFRTMIRAGVPMMRLLSILKDQTENLRLKRTIGELSQEINEGASLYEAFIKHPKVFSPLFCSMVRAGESSGSLSDVLERMTYIIEHESKTQADIRAALQYPIIVIAFLLIAFFILLTFVIPKFVNIFQGAGLVLPLPTLICMELYKFVSNYWLLLIGMCVVIGIGLKYYLDTAQGKYFRDTLLMSMPILGTLFVKAAMSRFASIFAILQSSGVDVLDSMKILSGTIGNYAISREFDKINEQMEEGRGIAEPLKSAKYFTPIVINMVAIGEETSKLDEMLREVSDHYDFELEYAVKKLTDAVGPVLTVSLAVVVGFFALAIFLPMWDLIGIVD